MTQFNKNIPINITGPSYQSRSRPLASQQTKNFYHQLVEAGKDQFVLHPFPGLKFIDTPAITGIDRGGRNALNKGFRVVAQKLYSFNVSGQHVEVGDIAGVDRCIISDDGSNLVIVSNTGVYVYDGSTITVVTDTNIVGATAVTFINNQMVYTVNNLFVVANVGVPTTANGLNAAAAESQPDDLKRAYAFQQNVYMFGDRSTEPFWNSGTGNPPFDRIDGQIFEVGLGAIHSVANTDEAIYWFGDDHSIYRATGGTKQRISSTAISHAISTYSIISDAHAYTMTFEGQNFYLITFPSADKTWVLSESLGVNGWFEVSSGLLDGKYQGSSLINVFNKNFVFDVDNGNLYTLDLETNTNNDDIIQRRRTTSSINGKLLSAPGARVQMSRFEVLMETGETVLDGQGTNAKIQFEVSYNGGRSFEPKGWGVVGRLGEFILRVEMYNLDSFYDCIVRLTTTDPVRYHLYSATTDLRLAGR